MLTLKTKTKIKNKSSWQSEHEIVVEKNKSLILEIKRMRKESSIQN